VTELFFLLSKKICYFACCTKVYWSS